MSSKLKEYVAYLFNLNIFILLIFYIHVCMRHVSGAYDIIKNTLTHNYKYTIPSIQILKINYYTKIKFRKEKRNK